MQYYYTFELNKESTDLFCMHQQPSSFIH